MPFQLLSFSAQKWPQIDKMRKKQKSVVFSETIQNKGRNVGGLKMDKKFLFLGLKEGQKFPEKRTEK